MLKLIKNRGIAKYNLGDYKGAFEDYNEAINLNPKLAEKVDPIIKDLKKKQIGKK